MVDKQIWIHVLLYFFYYHVLLLLYKNNNNNIWIYIHKLLFTCYSNSISLIVDSCKMLSLSQKYMWKATIAVLIFPFVETLCIYNIKNDFNFLILGYEIADYKL